MVNWVSFVGFFGVESATNENDVGSLQSFEIASGVLSPAIDTVGSGGNGPAFTAPLSTGQVAIMNVRTFCDSSVSHVLCSSFPCDFHSAILIPLKQIGS